MNQTLERWTSGYAVDPETHAHGREWRLVGDPIDVVTGANTDVITDFRLHGPLPLRWQRHYSSARNSIAGPLGWGHTHSFDRTLVADLDGLRYRGPLGKEVGFPSLGVGLTTMEAGIVIKRTGRTTYQVVEAGEPVQLFDFASQNGTARLLQLRLKDRRVDARIEFRYNRAGRLIEIVDSLRRSIEVESDASGRIVALFTAGKSAPGTRRALMQYEYDAAGNIAVARDYYASTLQFRWDAANRMTRRTDRLGYSFHFSYDDSGRCVHSRGDDGLFEVFLEYQPEFRTTVVRRGDGGTWKYEYDDNQNVTKVTDPYGHATKIIVDESGRPVQEVDPNGNVTTLSYDWRGVHDYRVDPHGNVLPTRAANATPADPLASVHPTLPLEWDFGRRIEPAKIGRVRRDGPVLAHFPTVVVDALLKKSSSSLPSDGSAATGSAPEVVSGADPQPVQPAHARVTQTWKHDANGNLVERRDRDGSIYRFVYKSWNALTQTIDPLGNTTAFDLTVQGLMSRVTDPGGTVTEYAYDLKDNLIEVREDGKLVESYRRDPAGNVVEKRDSSGRTLVSWTVGPGNLDKVELLGSGEERVFGHDAKGRIARAQTLAGTATFAYDEFGNLLCDLREGRGVVHAFAVDRVTSTTYFGRFRVNYLRDRRNEIVVEDPTGARHRFLYSQDGVIAKLLANGSRELDQFDSAGQCRFKAVVRDDSTSDAWIRRYEASPAGDVVAVADSRRGTTRYRYDAAHRLTDEVTPDGQLRPFELDAAGNLVRQPGLTGVVVGDGNRLQQANGDTLTYNDRLNLSERRGACGVIRYVYDALDTLTECDINGEPWSARYDGLGRRTEKTWRSETTKYYWDDFRLAAEVRPDGTCRLYVYADEVALAPFLFLEYESLDADPASGRRFYVFTNQVAAPIHVEDDSGASVWSARIDPYGNADVDSSSTIELNLRFPGHYFDTETKLHYNRFRYFSPELGRYLQSDPAGLAGGINAYAYPDKPLTVVDVNGLGVNGARAPKTKDGPFPSVGCHAKLKKDQSPLQVRDQLKAKADKLLKDIKKEQKKNAKREKAGKPPVTHVRAPDGTLLQIHPDPQPGPCLSVAYDSKTGKTYYGQNTEKRPDPMHPTLARNATKAAGYNKENFPNAKPPGVYPRKGVPGDHSEVNAVNSGMLDRDKDPNADPPHPNEYTVYNVNTNGQTQKAGEGKPCCPNCQKTLDGPNAGRRGKDWVPDPDGGVNDVSDASE